MVGSKNRNHHRNYGCSLVEIGFKALRALPLRKYFQAEFVSASRLNAPCVLILIGDPTGKWANDPLRPWFEALKNKEGLVCCVEADGHPLDESEWDIKDNTYRVFIQGEWIVVPDHAVISGPNKFGKAIVWVWPQEVLAWSDSASNFIRCFIPGPGV